MRGCPSSTANADEQQGVEVWLIGREGVVGSPAVRGVSASPLKHLVQVGGSSLRIGVGDLSQALTDVPRLRTLLLNYLHVALLESLQSALAAPYFSAAARTLAAHRTGS
jgi:hypothetical protein